MESILSALSLTVPVTVNALKKTVGLSDTALTLALVGLGGRVTAVPEGLLLAPEPTPVKEKVPTGPGDPRRRSPPVSRPPRGPSFTPTSSWSPRSSWSPGPSRSRGRAARPPGWPATRSGGWAHLDHSRWAHVQLLIPCNGGDSVV